MTSFEPPDAGLLVEHLLPSLLQTHRALSQDPKERTLFFGELGTELEALHSRLSVISSPPHEPRDASPYPWLWRYVSHFYVGSEARAVQHAKLWAFHWKVGDEEALELRVSSTNLTSSAFKTQLQAGWQVTLPLEKKASHSTRRTWGDLVPFLEALGASAGNVAAARVRRLVGLLSRAACPAGVAFIASVPGGKSAARRLAELEPSEIHVLTPTIGEWNESTLAAWTKDAGINPENVHLKWIAETHPWAATSGWALSKATSECFAYSGVHLDCLSKDTRFAEQHRDQDPRWSHAKLYLLRSRRRLRLLITSANWSVAAWGAGRTSPRNFELGVVFDSEWTDLEAMGEPFDPPTTVPFCVARAEEQESVSPLAWAEASWDGSRIALRVRSTDGAEPISVVVAFVENADETLVPVQGEATMPWCDSAKPPLTARFRPGASVLEVHVLDLRPPALAKTPLPEVDPAVEAELREAFLLQRYGGPLVDAESIPGLGGERTLQATAPVADYAVQAWVEARSAFRVIDAWRAALDEAGTENLRREQVRTDGAALRALFGRREGPWAPLVVEELGWRLEEDA